MGRKIRTMVVAAAVLTLLLMLMGIGVGNAAQTSDSASHTVTFNNKAAVRLTLAETTYNFGDVDPITNGGVFTSPDNAVNPNVRCNSNWTLYVRGSGDFSSGTNSIPLSRLGWRAGGIGSYTTMGISDAVVAKGSRTGNAGVTTSMGYQLTITFDDPAADGYSTTIIYTATTP